MSIYDRSTWPDHTENPLILLFENNQEWYTNAEIMAALGYTDQKRSLISQWPTLAEQIGEEHTGTISRGLMVPDADRQRRGGGTERYFTRKAFVLIAMRAQTVNAAAFCDYVAEDFAFPDLDRSVL